MSDHSAVYSFSETDCDTEYTSDFDTRSNEAVMTQLEEDIMMWLEYCRIAERIVREFLGPNRAWRYLLPTTRCIHKLVAEHSCLSINLFPRLQDVSSDIYALHAYFSQQVRHIEQCKHWYFRIGWNVLMYTCTWQRVSSGSISVWSFVADYMSLF